MDIKCVKCAEPWDYYGLLHGDVSAWEADMILQGCGCPACCGIKNISLESELARGVSIETSDIIVPSDLKYEKPAPLLIFTCGCCDEQFSVDQDQICYDGDKRVFETPCSMETEDGLVCESCYEDQYSICDYCNKRINHEFSAYIQDLNEVICHDCYENGEIALCSKCDQHYEKDDLEIHECEFICKDCLKEKEDGNTEE